MITRHIETLFCDDIRHEVGGKLSFIGVYSGVLFVPVFPVTLPKLCLFVKIVTPAQEPLRVLNLSVLRDEETLQEITLDEEQLTAASDSAEEISEEQRKERVLMAQFMLVFSPIQFAGPCTLRVRVHTEDSELRGMALKVDQAPTPSDMAPAKPSS
ncbi:MAG: hypothetical protein H6964_12015 [Chromatiaceae bacterium]|nr:hypothetical protein [Chromatiaceae bacterium]MCP5447704.1 hypothetical protein [Chromatiaceae bacterium]